MIETNKHLGQSFLVNPMILKCIANVCNLSNKNVVEIGPGTGNLTKYILENKPKTLTLYEIDVRFIKILQDTFIDVQVLHKNCLDISINTDVIISNLPYNISTQFCKKLILEYKFEECVLLLQKEFAEKIIRIDNILGLVLNLTYNIKMIRTVSNESFRPKPKVQSAIVYLSKKLHNYDLPSLWKFADKLFSCSRKKIGKKFSLFTELRPAELTLENIIELYQHER